MAESRNRNHVHKRSSGIVGVGCVELDITERKRAEKALLESQLRMRSLIDNSPSEIVIKDTDLRYVQVNRIFEDHYGVKRADIVGKRVRDVLPTSMADAIEVQDSEVMTSGVPIEMELDALIHGETRINLESKFPIPDDDGNVIGIGGIATDITERKRAEWELAKAKEAADAANKAKGDLVAMVSHEIRTPMNGALGMARLLWETDLDDYQQDCVGTIVSSGEALVRLVDDLLDVSKLEAGALDLESIPFIAMDLVEQVIGLMASRADEKGLKLSRNVDPGIPPVLIGDPHRLRQILLNLVSNAIKFTSKGSVAVDATLVAREDDTAVVRFAVADTGQGIKAATQKKLFSPFSQGAVEVARKYGGTGLGLTICRRLAELMEQVPQGLDVPLRRAAGDRPHHRRSDLAGIPGQPASRPLERGRPRPAAQGPAGGGQRDEPRCRRKDPRAGRTHRVQRRQRRRGAESPQGADLRHRHHGPAYADNERHRGHPANPGHGPAAERDPDHRRHRRRQRGRRECLPPGRNGPGPDQAPQNQGFADHRRPARGTSSRTPGVSARRQGAGRRRHGNQPHRRRQAARKAGGLASDVEESATRALERAKEGRYDAILVDISMPDMDGVEFAEHLRVWERDRGRYTPVIAMTGHASEDERARFLDAGMDDYLTKPVVLRDLGAILGQWLAAPGTVPGPETPAAETGASAGPGAHPAIDMALLGEILGDDDDNEKLGWVDQFVGQFPPLLDALAAAIADRDRAATRDTAHAAKSAATCAAAVPLAGVLQQLEQGAGSAEWSDISAMAAAAWEELDRVVDFRDSRPKRTSPGG